MRFRRSLLFSFILFILLFLFSLYHLLFAFLSGNVIVHSVKVSLSPWREVQVICAEASSMTILTKARPPPPSSWVVSRRSWPSALEATRFQKKRYLPWRSLLRPNSSTPSSKKARVAIPTTAWPLHSVAGMAPL